MANEPVQVVTNPEQLRGKREKFGGGVGDDFFEGDDTGFARHRDHLAAALASIAGHMSERGWVEQNDTAGHVKVTMRAQAIAKTHRPQRALFRSAAAPHVATAGIGEPIYAVTSDVLTGIAQTIRATSAKTEYKIDRVTGKEMPNPSRQRCEISAIARIELWAAPDKRNFSAAEGAEWLRRAGTGGRYLVNFFPLPAPGSDSSLLAAHQVAARALQERLSKLSIDARARATIGRGTARTIAVSFLKPGQKSHLELGLISPPIGTHVDASAVQAADADRHEAVLRAFEESMLVQDISLPPIPLPDTYAPVAPQELLAPGLPERGDESVSRVGVIDGGVSDAVDDWVIDRWGQLASNDRDDDHGTFISGLLVAAGDFNPHFLGTLPSGCEIVDVDVLPADPGGTQQAFDRYYPGGVADFMDEVEDAVSDFRARLGVRVFNFSMNFVAPGDSGRYGYAARRLDEIAEKHDVIFVISAGNLPPAEQRPEWPSDHAAAVASIARDTTGLISEPAESLFNVSVSALNPPNLSRQVPFALARYSRRGPGLRGGTKPDFAHVGGSGTLDPIHGHGLFSIDTFGTQTTNAGTSFAAPLVARVLADLDHSIEGEVSREVLLALLVHYSEMPKVMRNRNVLPLARDLAGYGVPLTAESMLERPDNEIVIVVNSTVLSKEQHKLDFSWPEDLVDANGKCRGYARLTLVARPVLAYEHGDERVRVNIDAKLMQRTEGEHYENVLKPVNRPATARAPQNERELLAEASKWQVVKSFDHRLRGKGKSSQWRLLVEYLTRADENVPTLGVEFAAILTIADPDGNAPIFQKMRQHLGDLGVRTGDIRTNIRARVQGGRP